MVTVHYVLTQYVSVAPTSDKVIVCVTGTLRALGQSATRQMPGYEDTSLNLSLSDAWV